MNEIELEFLIACHESLVLRRPLWAELSASLDVPTSELFYHWAARRCQQRGVILGGEWAYFFHGIECDLRHTTDGRFVRIDFAPHGNTEGFTTWGVSQFVMASKAPWPNFTALKTVLDVPQYYQAAALGTRLESTGLIKSADPDLLALAKKFTVPNNDGIPVLRLPEGFSERTYFDVMVAGRKLISEAGMAGMAQLSTGSNNSSTGMFHPGTAGSASAISPLR
jgi:hypothetical protein